MTLATFLRCGKIHELLGFDSRRNDPILAALTLCLEKGHIFTTSYDYEASASTQARG